MSHTSTPTHEWIYTQTHKRVHTHTHACSTTNPIMCTPTPIPLRNKRGLCQSNSIACEEVMNSSFYLFACVLNRSYLLSGDIHQKYEDVKMTLSMRSKCVLPIKRVLFIKTGLLSLLLYLKGRQAHTIVHR